MAITVKDIRNKIFAQEERGYNLNEVDDFLDEIALQMEQLIRENAKLKEAVKAAEEKAEAALEPTTVDNAPVVQETLPTFNEPSYFKNLETTLRETLISAQRIADETIDDARKKARRIVTEAEEQAQTIEEQSAAKMAEARADYEALKNASEEYRRNFNMLVDGQAKILKESPLFT